MDDLPDYLRLSAERLLETFATGGLTPGAGSAVALTAALSAALICAVARLTEERAEHGSPRARERYAPFVPRAREIGARAHGCLTELTRHVREDAVRVAATIAERRRRDAAADSASRAAAERAAAEAMAHAAEIPRRVVELSGTLAALARELARDGYQVAAADARAAATLAGAAAEGARALLPEEA
jgi:formiminotetrahydrofolate cyclodeaminase